MTQAEHIMLTTRKRRKRQMILKGISAIYMLVITVFLIFMIADKGFPLSDNNNPDSAQNATPTPEDDSSNEQPDNTLPDKIDKDGKFVALTYDDGPSSYTSYLLDAFEEHNARATFFIVGNRADLHRDTIKRMDSLNMEISSHTYGHDLLTVLDTAGIQETMNKTDEALTNIIGHGANLMRPVEGAVNDLVQSTVNKPIIRWNVDTLDWKLLDTQAIVDHVLENVHDGCIILMHDLYPTTIEASKILIPKLQEMGYQLVTVPELAEARGIELTPGEIYRNFPKTEN